MDGQHRHRLPSMKRIDLLDYARLGAAISVVGFHYLYSGIQGGKIPGLDYFPHTIDIAKYGYLGVEFFFMISGYVIFFSCQNKTAGEFLASRAKRLYPAFWFAVLFTSLVAVFWGDEIMSVQLDQVIVNLTMVSPYFGYEYVDAVYWTLLFELKFYLAVFVLMLGMGRRLNYAFLVWPFVILIAQQMGWKSIPLTDSYYGFFAAGAVLAMMKGRPSKIAIAALIVCLILCIDFAVEKAVFLSGRKGVEHSSELVTALILLFFAAFLFFNSRIGAGINLPGARLAGGLTYPIYLIHAHFGYMFISRFGTEENKVVTYLATVSIVVGVSLFMHLIIERKLGDMWRRMFELGIKTPVDAIAYKIVPMSHGSASK